MHHLQWSDDPVRSAGTLPGPLPSQGRARLGNELVFFVALRSSVGTALLAPQLCHHGNSPGCLEEEGAGRRCHHPNPYLLLVPGGQATPAPYSALLAASHRARPGSPPLSTWPRSGSRRTLYHPSLEEAATVPTTTWQWDLLIEATSSRLGCHNIDSTRQCVVAHQKCAIHSFASLFVDVIIPVMSSSQLVDVIVPVM